MTVLQTTTGAGLGPAAAATGPGPLAVVLVEAAREDLRLRYRRLEPRHARAAARDLFDAGGFRRVEVRCAATGRTLLALEAAGP